MSDSAMIFMPEPRDVAPCATDSIDHQMPVGMGNGNSDLPQMCSVIGAAASMPDLPQMSSGMFEVAGGGESVSEFVLMQDLQGRIRTKQLELRASKCNLRSMQTKLKAKDEEVEYMNHSSSNADSHDITQDSISAHTRMNSPRLADTMMPGSAISMPDLPLMSHECHDKESAQVALRRARQQRDKLAQMVRAKKQSYFDVKAELEDLEAELDNSWQKYFPFDDVVNQSELTAEDFDVESSRRSFRSLQCLSSSRVLPHLPAVDEGNEVFSRQVSQLSDGFSRQVSLFSRQISQAQTIPECTNYESGYQTKNSDIEVHESSSEAQQQLWLGAAVSKPDLPERFDGLEADMDRYMEVSERISFAPCGTQLKLRPLPLSRLRAGCP